MDIGAPAVAVEEAAVGIGPTWLDRPVIFTGPLSILHSKKLLIVDPSNSFQFPVNKAILRILARLRELGSWSRMVSEFQAWTVLKVSVVGGELKWISAVDITRL